MNKKLQRRRYNAQLENYMSQIKFMHYLNNFKVGDVLNFDDPNHPNRYPTQDIFNTKMQADMPNEIKKLLNKGLVPDMQSSYRGLVYDEASART
jgi:hypothetical protein